MICDDLEAWDGRGNGSETQEKGDVRILMAGSCCCAAETSTEVQSNYPPVKNKIKMTLLPLSL